MLSGIDGSQRMQDRVCYGSRGSNLQDRFYSERRETMIVNRRTFNVRPGRMEEAVELAAKELERGGNFGAVRIYTISIGRFDQMAIEWEFQNLAEYEKGWAEWIARPTSADFLDKLNELIKSGGTNEIWNLAG